MIRLRGRVEYQGGNVVEFETGSAALAAWELYALRHNYPIGASAPPILSTMLVAHHALGIEAGFETWRESVVGVELESEGVPPTLPAPSAVA